jgi:hypothetical protein
MRARRENLVPAIRTCAAPDIAVEIALGVALAIHSLQLTPHPRTH